MLTAAEAAHHLGVKLGTLYAYVSRGWIKSYRRRVGRQALYRRADIEALRGLVAPERGRRARSLPDASSWVTVAQPVRAAAEGPAPGVIVTESAVSSIADGRLAYRGYPIEEVIEHATFEEVCLLLWNGERPTRGSRGRTSARDSFGEDTVLRLRPRSPRWARTRRRCFDYPR